MKLSRILHRLGHHFGGPTYAVRRPDGALAVRMAFDDDEATAAIGPVDDVIGHFRADGGLVVLLESPHRLRLVVYRATTATGRCWTYQGERVGEAPVWRMGPGVVL